jgi:hypothetical protein
MNDAQLIINMQQIINQLEKVTRSSRLVDYVEVRELCNKLENDAHALWSWAMTAEDQMDMESWRIMRERRLNK